MALTQRTEDNRERLEGIGCRHCGAQLQPGLQESHAVEVNHRDPAELMAEYQEISRQLAEAQSARRAS